MSRSKPLGSSHKQAETATASQPVSGTSPQHVTIRPHAPALRMRAPGTLPLSPSTHTSPTKSPPTSSPSQSPTKLGINVSSPQTVRPVTLPLPVPKRIPQINLLFRPPVTQPPSPSPCTPPTKLGMDTTYPHFVGSGTLPLPVQSRNAFPYEASTSLPA